MRILYRKSWELKDLLDRAKKDFSRQEVTKNAFLSVIVPIYRVGAIFKKYV